VLQVVGSTNRGGIESFIMNVYRKIDRSKLQFDFLTHTEKEGDFHREILDLGGRISHVTGRKQSYVRNRIELDAFFRCNAGYRVVHQHVSSLTYIDPLMTARRFGVPIRIVHSHNTREGGSKLHAIAHYLNRLRISHLATDYFACSDLASEWLFGKNSKINQNVKVIPNGIDQCGFTYSPSVRDKVRKSLNLGDALVIGNVANFSKAKNHLFVLGILQSILEERPDTKLVLVGDGPLRFAIEEQANQLGIQDSVLFMGKRGDVKDILQAIDVFVMPSIYEGLPVALVEAQAAGLLTLVSSTVTRNAQLTPNIAYMDLALGPRRWAQKILEESRIYKRRDTSAYIVGAGFDIASTARMLEGYYLNRMDVGR